METVNSALGSPLRGVVTKVSDDGVEYRWIGDDDCGDIIRLNAEESRAASQRIREHMQRLDATEAKAIGIIVEYIMQGQEAYTLELGPTACKPELLAKAMVRELMNNFNMTPYDQPLIARRP